MKKITKKEFVKNQTALKIFDFQTVDISDDTKLNKMILKTL